MYKSEHASVLFPAKSVATTQTLLVSPSWNILTLFVCSMSFFGTQRPVLLQNNAWLKSSPTTVAVMKNASLAHPFSLKIFDASPSKANSITKGVLSILYVSEHFVFDIPNLSVTVTHVLIFSDSSSKIILSVYSISGVHVSSVVTQYLAVLSFNPSIVISTF